MFIAKQFLSLVIGGFSSWNFSKAPVAAMVLTKLCPCRSLAGSMLFCHLIKYMMVMTRATLMSPRLCWWGIAQFQSVLRQL